MTLKEHNLLQIQLALGDTNRYYYDLHYQGTKPNPSDEELLEYFIEYGAVTFRREHPD